MADDMFAQLEAMMDDDDEPEAEPELEPEPGARPPNTARASQPPPNQWHFVERAHLTSCLPRRRRR